MSFLLHEKLTADTLSVGRLPLSLVLLSRDARYPWCLLVPQREGVTELHALSTEEQHQLTDESTRLSLAMVRLFQPDSMNVAALGNVVSQLHLHHVARYRVDAAWPGPVWGQGSPAVYSGSALKGRVHSLREALAGPGFEPA